MNLNIAKDILVRLRKITASVVVLAFLFSTVTFPVRSLSAQEAMPLPTPGEMIGITASYVPPMLKGMRVNSADPFAFDFLLDSGNANFDQSALKRESNRLIKYFLVALTIPEDDLWVNLSPYEKNRIIADELGITEMGRDLLSQDYILKQLTASMIYPEKDLGKEFWSRVYAKARQVYGTENIPVETFNKVWIVPDKAVVYQNKGTVYILQSHLKVMLEEDYVAQAQPHGESPDSTMLSGKRPGNANSEEKGAHAIGSQIVRDVVLPEIEKEVNEGQHFLRLRQIYSSLILAKWYKQNLRQSILNREYSDQKKIAGVDLEDKNVKEKIYEQYLKAYKKGVFNYIKEDYDSGTQKKIPRKYFSGGLQMRVPLEVETNPAILAQAPPVGKLNWINGVYRQPRVSARYVNEYVSGQFTEGKTQAGNPVSLLNGREAKVYLIEGLLRATGQFGHIGLGAKERKGEAVVYEENGVPVVYLDRQYADDQQVRANEQYKVEKWEAQKGLLGQERGLGRPLTAPEMREWIKDNFSQAARLLRQWENEAPSLGDLFKKAQADGQLPSAEAIAGTYVQADDFRDLNLAGGRTAEREKLVNIPARKLHNTSVILENVILFVKRLDNPGLEIRISGINALDSFIGNKLIDQKVVVEFALVEKLVKALRDEYEGVRAAAATALGHVLENDGDIGAPGISALEKALGDRESWRVRVAAAGALGHALVQGGDIGPIVLRALEKALGDGDSSVRSAVATALGQALAKGGDIGATVLSDLVKLVGEGNYDVPTAAVMALGQALENGGDIGAIGISTLVKALGDGKSWLLRTAAATALGQALAKGVDIGVPGISALEKALGDGDSAVRVAAATALGQALAKGVDIGVTGISALEKALGDGNYDVRIAAATALGQALEKGWDIGSTGISALVTLLGYGNDGVRTAAARALGQALAKGWDIGFPGISALVKAFGDSYDSVRTAAAGALGYALEKGGDIGATVFSALEKSLREGESGRVRSAAITALGHALVKGGDIGTTVLSVLVKSLRDGDYFVRVAAATALGDALAKGVDIGADGISALEESLGDAESWHVRAAAAKALGQAMEKGVDIGVDGISALLRALADRDYNVRAEAATALGQSSEKGGGIGATVLSALEKSLGDAESWHVRTAAVKALGQALAKGGDIGVTGISALVKSLGDGNYDFRTAVATALGHALDKGNLETLTPGELKSYYSLVQNERKSREILSDIEINSRRALVLKVHSVMEGRINPDDVKYVEQIADVTEDRDSLASILDSLRGWSVDGSADAQSFLEGRVGQIVSRRPASGKNVIEISERDVVFMEATTGSFRQRSLLPILTGRKFPLKIREQVMRALAQSGYIDSGYADVNEKDVQKYLDLMAQVFIEFKLVAPKILVENLIDQETTIEELKSRKPMVESLLLQRDHRVLIKALAKDEGLLFVYYMLNQSPFQYQGTDPISFERFKSLVYDAFEKLELENRDIVEGQLVEGYVNAGLDRQRAQEIADAVLKGRPPLPKDSPYLDKHGNFIPQRVDVLATLGDSDGTREAQDSFRSSVGGIVMVLKINDLLARIPAGIERRFSSDPEKQAELKKQYGGIVHGIKFGVDLTKVFAELTELNDRIFPPQGRKRDINVMIAQAINSQIRNTPMSQNMMNVKKGTAKETAGEDGRIDLEDLDINALVRNSDTMVNALKARQKEGKLTALEMQIVKEGEIKIEHVIKIFFAELIQRLNMTVESPLHSIFQNLEAHAIAAFNNHVQAMSQNVDLRQVPQVVYVDFVAKFNLLEFFRFSDGAHCCLASDPNVNSQYGMGTYEREMPRYIANATSFWWQFTTDSRAGKQIGWYENWVGLEDGKVFVGTELTYMAPGKNDRDLQTAILAKVEEILFSTKVTKIAQAGWGNHAANALSSPPSYEDQTISMLKLQSLEDGGAIYEDAPVETNTPVTKDFKVKDHPGERNVPESGRFHVLMEFIQPVEGTDELVDQLIEIEEQVFPEDKQEDEEYMRRHLTNPRAVILVLKDRDTEEIVGYVHAVPALSETNGYLSESQYREFTTQKNLYISDIALLPPYWGKAGMGDKFRAFFAEAKSRGYQSVALHTESTDGVRPGRSLSRKLQDMGFAVKFTEDNWQGTNERYDFLVLNLGQGDLAQTGDAAGSSLMAERENMKDAAPGGIDFNFDLLELEIQGQEDKWSPPESVIADEYIHIENGLLPVIIHIWPVESLPVIFGAADTKQPQFAEAR